MNEVNLKLDIYSPSFSETSFEFCKFLIVFKQKGMIIFYCESVLKVTLKSDLFSSRKIYSLITGISNIHFDAVWFYNDSQLIWEFVDDSNSKISIANIFTTNFRLMNITCDSKLRVNNYQ